MDITSFLASRKAAPKGALAYDELARLSDGNNGVTDAPCPLCGPGRQSQVNRKRKVLRIWHKQDGFVSYCCARCNESGYAHQDGTQPLTRKRLKKVRQETAQRDKEHAERQHAKALWLWRNRQPIEDTPAAKYLRDRRRYGGPFPATLGFLPPLNSDHHPALISAFGIPDEPEPDMLSISDEQVRGIHLTLLQPDGSDKSNTKPDKIMVGPSNGWPIVLAPMNDALGLIICEGIESGLSLYETTSCGVWAAGAAGRMPALADKIPAYADCVTIAGEPDDAGRKGVVELKKLLKVRGLYCELRILDGEEAQAA